MASSGARVGQVGVAGLCLAALALAWGASASRFARVARGRASERVQARALPTDRPASEGFVGSKRCQACHPDAYATWHQSWHRTMTQAVGAGTVLGDFARAPLPHADGPHALERRGEEFWVRMPEANWLLERGAGEVEGAAPFAWQRVVMSTGAHTMQLYWVAAEPGRRLVAFPFAWSVEGQTWVANEATLLRPHEPDVVYGWNEVCLKCHAVAGAPEVELGADQRRAAVGTEVAELGIACEACHGPGADHVEAQTSPLRRYLAHLGRAPAEAIVHPGRLDAHRSSEICGQCHSASIFPDHQAWLGRGSAYRAGDELAASTQVVRHPVLADQPWIDGLLDVDPDYLSGRFWGDGTVRISGRDYNGLIESPCYADVEFGCASCHEMHGDFPDDQLSPFARNDDDRQCTQCHTALGEDEGLGSALAEHTRHAADSAGSRCVNCHMPHTVYGLTKAIRSHRISTPSVEESVSYGRPNACNACHLDRSLAWTARALEQGWGLGWEGELGELGLAEGERSAAVDWLVRGDAGQRALAAWAFGWPSAQATAGTDWMAPLLVGALDDEYAAVRWVALRSLRTLPGYGALDWSLARPLHVDGAPELAEEQARLWAEWAHPGRVEPALYLGAEGFEQARWRHDHERRDRRPVDLRE
ncbi:hypothetical protein PPSIR1_41779 [Plesiocystis pacifica SIR-1]|uniref:C cytochrome n=1 Tax=Plesiocystis pacifica SIR-1 TaxID=391625 RepID=A6G0U7_9BACT|nr:multiheme c-type cytochrome [Plesiocystis pacifica]EDM80485.1 hypothetical protein PPSIR1_41779 [Plesiocystis pacifica SIR-1]